MGVVFIRLSRILFLISVPVYLSGCSGFAGSRKTLDGDVPAIRSNMAIDTPVYTFSVAYNLSFKDNLDHVNNAIPIPISSTDITSVRARILAEQGIALIDSYCDQFFEAAGDNQKWLDLGKDVTTVLGTLATGTLAIASPSNSAAAAATALFTGTAYNGVDLYTRNFLFGSDNIATVHGMIGKILATDKATSLPSPDTSIWTFSGALQVIRDHQKICTAAEIRNSVLGAIANGQFQQSTAAGSAFAAPAVKTADAAGDTVPAAAAAAAAATTAPAIAAAAVPAATASATAAAAAADQAATTGGDAVSISAATNAAALSVAKDTIQKLAPRATVAQVSAAANAVTAVIAPVAAKAAIAAQTAVPTAPPASRHTEMVPVQAPQTPIPPRPPVLTPLTAVPADDGK